MPAAMTQRCRRCGKRKLLGHFARLGKSPTGHATMCKQCTNAARKAPATRKAGVRAAILKSDGAKVRELTQKDATQHAWALRHAAQRGKPDILRQLLRRKPAAPNLAEALTAAVSAHHTIRHTAAHCKAAAMLLRAGADPEHRAGWAYETALLAASRNGCATCIDLLLARGVQVDPWALAALGEVAKLRRAIRRNPEIVSHRDPAGLMPLHYAAASRRGRRDPTRAAALAQCAAVLLDAGAPISATDAPGNARHFQPRMSALHYACAADNFEVARLLVARGADVNQPSNWGTPVAQACKHSPAIADLLAAHGAQVSAPLDDEGLTALHIMANFPHPDAVRWLLVHGADVNSRTTDGRTPLHRAAERNTGPAVAEMLLEAGAEINARDASGHTPLSYALENRKQKVAALLRARGGKP